MASLYLENNTLKYAKAYLDSITPLATTFSDKIIALNYYENQVEYHQKIKNYKNALAYQISYSKLYEEIYNLEQTEIVQNMQSRFDYEKKENEILKLSLINKNSQLQLIEKNKNIKNKNLTLFVLAIVILVSFILYYLFFTKTKSS